jgi:septum formation protein
VTRHHEGHVPSRTIVLASASPRRRELLDRLGLSFVVAPTGVDETRIPSESPSQYALRLAAAKARAAAAGAADALVLGSDTIVVLEDEILGKPSSDADAREYLERLRARDHQVLTAVAVYDTADGRLESGTERTRVWMRNYTADEVSAYIDSGDPLDKAGAYAIQHDGFHPVARLEGSRTNVIGLPLGLVRELLDRFGVEVPVSVDSSTRDDASRAGGR